MNIKKRQVLFYLFAIVCIAGIIFFFEKGGDPNVDRPYVDIGGEIIFLEIADTDFARAKGLSERESLEENEGMLFLFSEKGRYGFWMKDVRFPIDIVWLDGDGVVWIEKNVPPEIGIPDHRLSVYAPDNDADKVLEIRAGKADETGLKIGDHVTLNI